MKLKPGNYGNETSFEVRNFDAEMSLDEYARLPKHSLYLVLDNLRSAFNVGSIFRAADAARLQGIYTCGYTAPPPPTQREIPVWALETSSQSRCYTAIDYPRALALVVGNEALGIDRAVLDRCDELIEIPMYGYKNSLNVAAASAVLAFEVLRQWQTTGATGEPTARA